MTVSDEERRRVAGYLEDEAPVTWEGLYRAVMGRPIPLETGAEEDARALCGRLAEMIRPGEVRQNAREGAGKGAGEPKTGGPEPECLKGVPEAHRPLCAADGKPYRRGQTVYHVDDGDRRTVNGTVGEYVILDGCKKFPLDYTHERPVRGADGVPIKVGDTVWFITDKYADDKTREFSVRSIAQEKIEVGNCQAYHTWTYGQHLTHIKPEPPDSWERIEQDAKNIWGKPIPFGKDAESTFTCRVVDLVRRCKALAAEKHGGYDLRRMYDDFTSYLECCDEPDWTFYNEIIGAIERYWQNGGE